MADGAGIAAFGKMPPGDDRIHGGREIGIVRYAQDRGIVAHAQQNVRARCP